MTGLARHTGRQVISRLGFRCHACKALPVMTVHTSVDNAAMAHRPGNKAGLLMAGCARLRRWQVIRRHAPGSKLLPVNSFVASITRISRGNMPARLSCCRCAIVASLASALG